MYLRFFLLVQEEQFDKYSNQFWIFYHLPGIAKLRNSKAKAQVNQNFELAITGEHSALSTEIITS